MFAISVSPKTSNSNVFLNNSTVLHGPRAIAPPLPLTHSIMVTINRSNAHNKRASLVHSLLLLIANLLCWAELRAFGFEETFVMDVDPMQPIIHSLYSSFCNHVAAFVLFFAQKLLHLKGQSSNPCILVVDLILYLESHLLCVLIATVEGVLEFTASPWNIQREGLLLQSPKFWRVVCCVDWGVDKKL
jgi:hypothetical protein